MDQSIIASLYSAEFCLFGQVSFFFDILFIREPLDVKAKACK